MAFALHTIRHYSQHAMKTTRSRKAIVIYSYLVVCNYIILPFSYPANSKQAGFTLPFAGPVASKLRGGEEGQAR
jgi:hypothetical protein